MIRITKIILSGAALITVLFPISAYASSNSSSSTNITGTISLNGHHSGNGIKVIVTCDGNNIITHTNSLGVYDVTLTSKECAMGTTVSVSATINGITQMNTGKDRCNGSTVINVDIIQEDVPEFGTIAEISATIVSIGAFMIIRRSKLSAS